MAKRIRKDQRRWLDWIKEKGTPRGFTLGKGRPHDRRIIQSLIDSFLIRSVSPCEILQGYYGVRGTEDGNGIALISYEGTTFAATYHGELIRKFNDEDHAHEMGRSAYQNGFDTASEYYKQDDERHYWMWQAIAVSTLEIVENQTNW